METYRVVLIYRYVDHIGGGRYEYHAPQRIHEQPWWSSFAAIVLVGFGVAVVSRLLPDWRLRIRRLANPTFCQSLRGE